MHNVRQQDPGDGTTTTTTTTTTIPIIVIGLVVIGHRMVVHVLVRKSRQSRSTFCRRCCSSRIMSGPIRNFDQSNTTLNRRCIHHRHVDANVNINPQHRSIFRPRSSNDNSNRATADNDDTTTQRHKTQRLNDQQTKDNDAGKRYDKITAPHQRSVQLLKSGS